MVSIAWYQDSTESIQNRRDLYNGREWEWERFARKKPSNTSGSCQQGAVMFPSSTWRIKPQWERQLQMLPSSSVFLILVYKAQQRNDSIRQRKEQKVLSYIPKASPGQLYHLEQALQHSEPEAVQQQRWSKGTAINKAVFISHAPNTPQVEWGLLGSHFYRPRWTHEI